MMMDRQRGISMRLTILVLGFAMLFDFLFSLSLEQTVLRLLPAALPASAWVPPGHAQILAIDVFLDWIIPLAVATAFVLKTRILPRSTSRAGWILMAVAVAVYLVRMALLYATTFMQGGGPTFAMAYLLAYLDLPLRLLLVIGAVRLLVTLRPAAREA